MGVKSTSLKSTIAKVIFLPLAFMVEVTRLVFSRLRLSLFHQRHDVIKLLAAPTLEPKNCSRVLAVIAHIASIDEAKDENKAVLKIDKLTKTIEGLVASFSHCDIQIIVSTIKNRHITNYLPEYQRRLVRVQEYSGCDSWFVGFKAQDEFINKFDDFDWFIFIEDDIVIHDSYLLEKLENFNKACGHNRAILLPNRYEIWQGIKTYIDLVNVEWNKFSIIEVDKLKFAECQNPHSGFYCLSKPQLKLWIESGRFWNNKVTFVSPLESAATGCLFECFSVYKPYCSNLNYFEIRHWDTKYSQIPYKGLNPAHEN